MLKTCNLYAGGVSYQFSIPKNLKDNYFECVNQPENVSTDQQNIRNWISACSDAIPKAGLCNVIQKAFQLSYYSTKSIS